ncbi:MAG TPA: phosphoenolpyruvate--protein phosphotransferase [Xanthomonadales bacterium]|nr:phosphoenolpyruvate--protein phosphotransferase [Xanthomonadales bacterium]
MAAPTNRIELDATAASKGLALGRARVVYPLHFEVEPEPIAPREVPGEIARFEAAIEAVRAELGAMRAKLEGPLRRDLEEFIDAHALMLEDPEITVAVPERIRRDLVRASAALQAQRDRLAAAFDSIEDPYLRGRREDVDQVVGRVFAALMRADAPPPKRGELAGEVLVCESLAPAELDHWHEQGLLGVVLAGGSAFSHAAILARSLRMPLVVGAQDALARIHDGDVVLVDGDHGRVVVRPDALDLSRLREYQRSAARGKRERARLKSAPTVTKDGVEIALYVNAEQPAELAQARRVGCAGVGLFRTEFLYLKRGELPTEEEQFRTYREAVIAMAGRPVTLRTLDLGADKAAHLLDVAEEPNPALGLRGLRLSLARRAVFTTQLRAMLRASAYGPVRVLLPMVASVDETRVARAVLSSVRESLVDAGVPVAESVDLGAMIEVPSAALISAELARELDFLAIGSNDLVQYTMAADRNNAAVSSVYDPIHPAVLRLLALVIENAERARTPLSLCGELAGDPAFVPLLLALGLTEFSMRPDALLDVRERVLAVSRKALRAKRAKLLEATDRAEVEAVIASL